MACEQPLLEVTFPVLLTTAINSFYSWTVTNRVLREKPWGNAAYRWKVVEGVLSSVVPEGGAVARQRLQMAGEGETGHSDEAEAGTVNGSERAGVTIALWLE